MFEAMPAPPLATLEAIGRRAGPPSVMNRHPLLIQQQ
jgi:hypothetical protein